MTADTTSARPMALRRAAGLWRFAVAAGVAESVIGITDAIRQEQLGAVLAINIGLRVVVYGVALVLIARLAAGAPWARIAITFLLSVIGLGSMLVPAVSALIGGATFLDAVGGSGLAPRLFAVIHVAHIASVVVATVLMYLPSASAFLRAHHGGGSNVASSGFAT